MRHKMIVAIKNGVILTTIIMIAWLSDAEAQVNDGGGRLAGTWDSIVTVRNCATGDAILSFQSVGSFNQGGTFSGITSGSPPTARTSERGVWRHLGSNVYWLRFKAYLYNPAAEVIGYQVVTHEIELDEKADTYISGGTSQIFDPNGVEIGSGCSTTVSTRMVLE